MNLSIVILTWNSKGDIDQCLCSVKRSLPSRLETEIIVIDNGSMDGSAQHLKIHYPEIKLIVNNHNKGVAPARNQGLAKAKGEYILILDIDTSIENNLINVMIQTMQNDNQIGLCGPKLVGINGKLQYSCRNFPTVMSKIYRQLPYNLQNHFLNKEELRDWDHCTQREVGYVIGACQFIRKTALEDVGMLDSKMFYGVEEIDFCLRLWKKGWKVVYNPNSEVIHFEQRLSRKRVLSRLQIEHIRSLVIYFLKHRYLFKVPSVVPIENRPVNSSRKWKDIR